MSRAARWVIGLLNAMVATPFIYSVWANARSHGFLRSDDILEQGQDAISTILACVALGVCLAAALNARCAWVLQRAVAYGLAVCVVWSGVQDYVWLGDEDLSGPGVGWYLASVIATIAVPFGLSVALRRSARRCAAGKGPKPPAA